MTEPRSGWFEALKAYQANLSDDDSWKLAILITHPSRKLTRDSAYIANSTYERKSSIRGARAAHSRAAHTNRR